jgi:cytochrome c oxidase subunit I+III
VVLIMVSGSIFGSLLFSYLFLWTVSPEVWPAPDRLPALGAPLLAGALLAAGSGLVAWSGRRLTADDGERKGGAWPWRLALLAALAMLTAASGIDLHAQWQTGLRPQQDAYAAVVYTLISLQCFFVIVMIMMALYTLARSFAGKLDGARRSTFDNTMLFWHYTTVQGLIGLGLMHAFPRLIG